MRIPTALLHAIHEAGNKIAYISTELGTNPKVSVPATVIAYQVYKWTTEDTLKAASLIFVTLQIIVILPKAPGAIRDIYHMACKGGRAVARAARYIATFF